jgi:putative ABC transport system permease protein
LLKNNYKDYFKHVLLAFWVGNYTLSVGDKKLPRIGEFIEGGAPDMLSLTMLKGNYAALNDPHSIIISKSTADALFGKEDPLNKSLKIDNRMDVIVRGVYEDIPRNNRFGEVQFFSTWALWVASNDWIKKCETRWDNNSFNIYVQTQPNVSIAVANAAVKDFYLKDGPPDMRESVKKDKSELFLYPMRQWHLYSEFEGYRPTTGRITFVWLFGIVGVFILLLACINFMNLSTARSEKRAKEVGIRKAIGSLKGQLAIQFLGESFLVVLLAFVLSVVLVALSLPWFNTLADKKMVLPFFEPLFWLINIVFIVLTGFLAGLYPAFYLSSFQTVKVLKGTTRLGHFAAIPRKVMVVVQFTVSIVLAIGTIVVYQQIQFAQNRPVGYNREGLISVPMNDPNYKGKQDVLRSELLNTRMVSDMTLSSSPLTKVWNNAGGFVWKDKDPESDSGFAFTDVSYDFGKMVGWKFIAGRDFSKAFATDSTKLIINETAAHSMGLKNPIGEIVKSEDSKKSWEIIGVIKDMIMGSPYEPEKRAFFFLDATYKSAALIHIKIAPNVSAHAALPKIEAVFNKIVPSAFFDYKFVDAQYEKKFSQETRIGKLAGFFALLALFISCLGLFGLASFVAEQRTKEIGIRKVLGASVANLWQLLSKEFVVLVVISCLIAIPIAYYLMSNWLQNYSYRTGIPWWAFALSGVGALVITLLTVSFQAVKAAVANPVKSLRTE